MPGEALLKVHEVVKYFGGLRVLEGVTFSVDRGELVGLIGPNGAGKTTAFEIISGFQRPTRGSVLFKDRRIDWLKPHEIYNLGVTRTFQVLEPLPTFSVFNAIYLGCLNKFRTGEARKRTSNLIELFGFRGREKALVSELTVGEQRRLDLARALVSEPEMVLLDEVMSGLTEVQAKEISDIIRQFNGRGTTFLLVEHVMRVVMNLCHRIVVLDQGKIIASGIPADVSTNPDVIRVYLGQ